MAKLLITKFTLTALIFLAVLFLVVGSVLPLLKSRQFVRVLNDMQSGKDFTPDTFRAEADGVLNFYSPMSHEELLRFLAYNIISATNILRDSTSVEKETKEAIMKFLAGYLESKIFNDDVRLFLYTATTYKNLFLISTREDEFKKAEYFYQKALSFAPKFPPAIYGLFSLYCLADKGDKMKQIGAQILQYWPDDANTKELLTTGRTTKCSGY